MKRPLLNSRRVFALLLLLLTGACFLPADWSNRLTARARDLLTLSMLPFRPVLTLAINFTTAGGSGQAFDPTAGDGANYLDLLAHYRQMQEELRAAQQTIAQMGALRHLPATGVELLPARAIASQHHELLHLLQLDRGQRDGVRQGLVVANGALLLGRISLVGPRTAGVRLITTPGAALTARILPPQASEPRDHVENLIADPNTLTFHARIDATVPVQVGDLAHLADDAWPREAQGLVIGRVSQIEPDPQTPQLRRQVLIEPLQSPLRLGPVLVLRPHAGPASSEEE